MKEDGFNTGYRRIGTFFLWSIPLTLGAAACVWLGFFMAAHGWFNELSQEKRRAVYVGAAELPKAKLQIETPNEGCIKITRVDLDGRTASLYFVNKCISTAEHMTVNWQLIAPDGTMLGSGSEYSDLLGGPQRLELEEKGEVVFSGYEGIKTDSRAKSIRFWIRQ